MKLTYAVWSLVAKREKVLLLLAAILLICLSILELVGLFLFTILINLLLTRNLYLPQNLISDFLSATLLANEAPFTTQAMTLGILVLALFSFRSLLTITLLRRLNIYFSIRASDAVFSFLKRLFSAFGTERIERRSQQDWINIVTRGIPFLQTRVLAGFLYLIADLSLLSFILLGLFIYDPILTIICIIIYGGVFSIINWKSQRRIKKFSTSEVEDELFTRERVVELINNYRDFFTNSSPQVILESIKNRSERRLVSSSELAFIPVLNRYFYEAAFFISTFIFGGLAFFRFEADVAVSALATFVLAVTRLTPSFLRIQQRLNDFKIVLPYSRQAIMELQEFENAFATIPRNGQALPGLNSKTPNRKVDFEIEVSNVSYVRDGVAILKEINMLISPGETVAIVGPTGSGKSTLVDLLIGVKTPSRGFVTIGGVDTRDSIHGNSSFGLVAQEVKLIQGSIMENITLFREISSESINKAIRISGLESLVSTLPQGIETLIGEGNNLLSGGERQRLGLARAIVGNPGVLILDEFTSNLDTLTEKAILGDLLSQKGSMTIVAVSHREEAIRRMKRIIEINEGRIFKDTIL